MNRRAFHRSLPLLLLAAVLVPTQARPAEPDNPCRLADDAPAFLCADAAAVRTVVTSMTSRGVYALLYGFETVGPSLPSATTTAAGACMLVSKGRSYTEMCGLPFDVVVDPLLETATIKGTTRDKRFGAIAVDVTFTADEDAAALPGGALGAGAGCAGLGAGTAAGQVVRGATASGTITVGKTTLRSRAAGAQFSHYLGAGGVTVASAPCAQERARGEQPLIYYVNCLSSFVEPVAGAAACPASHQEKLVSVAAKSKKATVRVIAVEDTALLPSIPDPSWIDATGTAVTPQLTACMLVASTGTAFGVCGGDIEIEMDPMLRTTHIKGEFPSPFGSFGGYEPPWIPRELDYGRALIDVTATPDERGMEAIGATDAFALLMCDGVVAVHRTLVMQGDGAATGYVVFRKRYGSFRGNQAKPLRATMDWSVWSLAAAFTYPDTCPAHEDYYG